MTVPDSTVSASPIARLGAALGLDRAALAHALRLWLAAWLAFGMAALLHIPNPYWAAMPIWVVAQPSRGLLFERGVFRVIGTLVGAALGTLILALDGGPWMAFALLGVVVAASATAVHTLRGIQAYGAMLTGMTAAVVVLPSVLDPTVTLAIAFSRVECTLIGVVVVTVVTGLFTPPARRGAFYRRVRALCGDAVDCVARAVGGAADADADAAERRVLAEIGAVDAAARLVAAGSPQGYRRLRYVDGLIAGALATLAAARALGDRRRRGETPPAGLLPALTTIAERLRAEQRPAAPTPPGLPSQALPGLGASAGLAAPASNPAVDGVAVDGAFGHPAAASLATTADPLLRRLGDALDQLAAAEDALFAAADEADARAFGPRTARIEPHRDWAQGRRGGLLAGGATFVAAGAAFVSGLPAGELVALGVCIFSMVLGSLPDPKRVAPLMLAGVIAGVCIATGYRFLIQPALATTLALLLSISPFLLFGALARASRRFALPAIDANMCFLLASQAGMPAAAAPQILAGSGALVIAAAVVCAVFLLLPSRARHDADAIARALGRDLQRLLGNGLWTGFGDWHPRAARQVLRLTLHLARSGENASASAAVTGDAGAAIDPNSAGAMLGALNLGHAIVGLRELAAQADLDPVARQQAARALSELRLLASEPAAVVTRLGALAESYRLTAATPVLLDAAHSLSACAALIAPLTASKAVQPST